MKAFYWAKTMSIVALMVITVGCNKDNDEIIDPDEKGDFEVVFTQNPTFEVKSKADAAYDFFANAGTNDLTQETDIKSVVIYIFKQSAVDDDNSVYRHAFKTTEIAKKRAVFSLSEKFDGAYEFFVIANYDNQAALLEVMSKKQIKELTVLSADHAQYNMANFQGASDAMFSANKVLEVRKDKGFTMYGYTTASKSVTEDSPRKVEVVLTRLVNKIAVRTKTSAGFFAKYIDGYGSTLKITKVTLKNMRTSSYVALPITTFTDFTTVTDLVQTPSLSDITNTTQNEGPYYDALFYSFENGLEAAPSSNLPTIEITAEFDFDGDGAVNQPITIKYNKKVLLNTTGLLKRNACYKLDVTINGLTEQEIVTSFTVDNWATPVTQKVDFGG